MSHNVLNVPVGVKLHADVKSFLRFQGCFRTKWILILCKCFTLLFLEKGWRNLCVILLTQSKYMTVYLWSHNCSLAKKEQKKGVQRFKQFWQGQKRNLLLVSLCLLNLSGSVYWTIHSPHGAGFSEPLERSQRLKTFYNLFSWPKRFPSITVRLFSIRLFWLS